MEAIGGSRGRGLFVAYVLLTCILGAIALAAVFVVPAFTKVFSTFGASLPKLTQFIIVSAAYWFVLPVASALIAIDLWRRKQYSERYTKFAVVVLVVLVIVAVTIVPLSVLALYWPIFRLGGA